MAVVFISYNRTSKAIAKTLAADIDALGHKAWFDQEISGGRAWWDLILSKVRECDVFIFILDPQSIASVACKREYGYAAELGKCILPVLVSDEVSVDLLPPALSLIQFVDYRALDREAGFRLARALSGIPTSTPLPEPLPKPPEAPISFMGSLTARVESFSPLSYDDQRVLVADLRRALRDPGNGEHAQRLLRALRKRQDLFAVFAEDVDDLLGNLQDQAAVGAFPARQKPIRPPQDSAFSGDTTSIGHGTTKPASHWAESFRKLAAIMDEIDPPPLGQAEPVPNQRMKEVDYDHDALILLKHVKDSLLKGNDPNNENWATIKGLREYDSIEGFWSSRWREEADHPDSHWHVGTAFIEFYKDWVNIRMEDDTNRYVIRCRMVEGNKLVGRYMNCEFSKENLPWVGIIVNNRRIDGFWQTDERWDFRR